MRWEVKSSGSLVLDTICSLGLFELAHRADLQCRAKFAIGHDTPLEVDFSVPQQMLKQRLSYALDGALNSSRDLIGRFWIKAVKKNAWDVLRDGVSNLKANIDKLLLITVKLMLPKKAKAAGLRTLYVAFMPAYGKGLRTWDESAKPELTYVDDVTSVSFILGLAFYGVISITGAMRAYLVIAPPVGTEVDESYLYGIRRLVSFLTSTDQMRSYVNRLPDVPQAAVSLAVLSQVDLPLLTLFMENPPSFFLLAIDVEKGDRGTDYELLSSGPCVAFSLGLDEHHYEFRRYMFDLVNLLGNKDLLQQAKSILIDLSRAVNYSRPDDLIVAIKKSHSLLPKLKEARAELFIPKAEALEKAAYALLRRS